MSKRLIYKYILKFLDIDRPQNNISTIFSILAFSQIFVKKALELCEETRVKNCAGSECLTDTLKEGSAFPYNGTSLSVSSNGQWRCYMREKSTGNVYITQKLTINTNSSVRLSASEPVSKVYPNPTFVGFENVIEFKLDQLANVKLELIDETGKVLEELANNIHDAGVYHYPFSLNSKSFSPIDQVYYRLTIDDRAETRRIILQ